jgi:hypothetical protein
MAYCTARFRRSNFGHQMPHAYQRVPHSSGGSWNLWAGIRTDKFCLDADFHGTSRDLLHAANLATWDPRLYFPSEGRHAEDFSALKNPTASAGFEPANLGTRGQPSDIINTFFPNHFSSDLNQIQLPWRCEDSVLHWMVEKNSSFYLVCTYHRPPS